MNMRVPPSSSSRYQPSQAGNSTTPPDIPKNSATDAPSTKTNQMREALNSYILNNAINSIQKKTNKTEQAHKKNVAKQKENKAQEEE